MSRHENASWPRSNIAMASKRGSMQSQRGKAGEEALSEGISGAARRVSAPLAGSGLIEAGETYAIEWPLAVESARNRHCSVKLRRRGRNLGKRSRRHAL